MPGSLAASKIPAVPCTNAPSSVLPVPPPAVFPGLKVWKVGISEVDVVVAQQRLEHGKGHERV